MEQSVHAYVVVCACVIPCPPASSLVLCKTVSPQAKPEELLNILTSYLKTQAVQGRRNLINISLILIILYFRDLGCPVGSLAV